MATLAFLLAAILDPVQAALVLAIVVGYRGPQPALVSAAAAAAASETIMTLAAAQYTWGELIVPRLLSSLMQAAVLCWVVSLARARWMGGGARLGAERTPGSATATPVAATLSALLAGSPDRLAPWQMRAFIRRRLSRLRSR